MDKPRSVLPWSWSSLDAYKTCPKRFYHTRIAKDFVEPETDALIWGNEVHKALECRVAAGEPLPHGMRHYEPLAAKLAGSPGDKYCELETAVDASYNACGFWDAGCWNRGYEDIVIVGTKTAISMDYKTGKKKPLSRQLILSGLRILAKFPGVKQVSTAFAWLQTGEFTRSVVRRDDANLEWDRFQQDIQDMVWSEKNNAWPMKPSGLCRNYCPVTSCPSNGRYVR